MKNVLVLCTGNSCRSQMAEGYLTSLGGDKVKAYSAGIETHGVNPRAIQIMKEDGIDISNHTSNHIDEYLDVDFHLILTVCDHAAESCPIFPSHAEKIHHSFSDPAKATGSEEEIMSSFRNTRNEIKTFIQNLLTEKL